ncbi:DUF6904 family protein [Ralstonia solanacearum]|uniref:DUF6904 family protein n=3 Tax=Ralstonia solanacearum TaxID=305 RepID=UPI0005C4F9BA|nr:hypothetical protein [Ralstonia solanacearum]
MLEYRLTPNHAGVALWGDFATLHRLHGFIHYVVQESVYIEDKEGFVLGLAYDMRKAFSGQRSEDHRGESKDDRCRIYGVEVLWPVLLTQVGVLRQAMAFTPTNKLDQAIMFELEHVTESAVRAATPVLADEVIHRMRSVANAPYMHVDSVLKSRCRYFIELPAKQRLPMLPKVMATFDPMYGYLAKTDIKLRPDVIPPTGVVA